MDGNNDKFLYSIDQMRIQRHDFMNYLQVIYGYLQIGKPQEAINYIKIINSKMAALGSVFSLNNPEIALILQEFFTNCSKIGIEFEFYTELEYISYDLFSKNIDSVRFAFKNVLKALADSQIYYSDSSVKLKMQVNESLNEFSFIIGISNEVIDLIEECSYGGFVQLLYHNTEENSKIYIYKNNNTFNALDLRFKKDHKLSD